MSLDGALWSQRRGVAPQRERRAFAAEDARLQRERRENLPKCGWKTTTGRPCVVPMPCRHHSIFRHVRDQAKARALLPKCGKRTRDGSMCDHPKPCQIHELGPNKRWCSSTLDSNPTERCQLQTEIGQMFCEKHLEFPDLGRKAAMYYQMCEGEDVDFTAFMKWAYPHTDESPNIYNFPLFAKSCYEKMSSA